MKIDGSGQWKTQRGVCSRAHGKRDPFDTSYCVAKRSSDRSLTRRPCPQVPQCHPRVARLSGTGVKPVFGRCSGRSSARQPCPQVLQGHLCVARPSSIDTLATGPRPQALQCHLPVAVRSGCSDGPSPRLLHPQEYQGHPRDKGGGNDCVRCVGSGFDLALRDGVRIFE